MFPKLPQQWINWLSTACACLVLAACGGGSETATAPVVPSPAWGSASLLIPAGQQSKTFQAGTCNGSRYTSTMDSEEEFTVYSAQVVVSADGSMVFRGSMTEGGTVTDLLSISSATSSERYFGMDADNGKITEVYYGISASQSSSQEGGTRTSSYIDLGAKLNTNTNQVSNQAAFGTSTRSNIDNNYFYSYTDIDDCDAPITMEAVLPAYLINEDRIASLFLKPINTIDPNFFDDQDARIINRNLVWNDDWGVCTPEDEESCTISGVGYSLNLDTAVLSLGGTPSTTTGLPASPTPIQMTLAKLLSLTSGYGYYYEGYSPSRPEQQESFELGLNVYDSNDPNVPNFGVYLERLGSTVYNDD